VCLAVRIVLFASGTRFSTAYFSYGWQIVPVDTLRDDPFGSVWRLHEQPPLFNLVTGVLLRWSPFPAGITFQLVFLLLAGILIVISHDLFTRLGAPPVVAAVIVVVIFCDPDWLRYELTPQYELPTALLLMLTVWTVSRLTDGPTRRRWIALTGFATAVVLTRSVLHPVWLLVILAAAVWYLRGRWQWRDLALAAVVPVVLIGGWVEKNEALFDHATLSSWFGMNLQRAAISPLKPRPFR